MTIKPENPLLGTTSMTPVERAQGRFMRAPDHPTEGDFSVDADADADDNDSPSGDAADDDDANDDNEDSDDNADDADNSDDSGQSDERSSRDRKTGAQRRIDRLTRELAAERAKNAQPPTDRAAGGGAADPNKKPVLTDFDTYEDFIEALADFKADQRFSEREQARERRTAEADFDKVFRQGQKAYKDWDDVVTADIEVTPHIVQAVKDCDNPADVTYYLGSHPDEADRISSLPPGKQRNAIAKIDATFDGKDNKTRLRSVSSAPEPISANKGTGGSLRRDHDKMDADEYIRTRNAELRKKRG